MEEKLAKAQVNAFFGNETPWEEIDILDKPNVSEDFREAVLACRFFYKHDGLAANVINKLVEIGINEVKFSKNGLTDNEYRIYLALKDEFKRFAESMAFEYLISGLVVPEIIFGVVTGQKLRKYGVKKRESLYLPVDMYVRDPLTIVIKEAPLSSKPRYFVEVDEKTFYFIMSNGKYEDGTEDKELFNLIKTYYPDFVAAVKRGEREFPVTYQDLVIARCPISGDSNPIPYLFPALEPLRHKRNLRRLDYALASRIIAGILHIKVGNDNYPLLEGDAEEHYNSIKNQLMISGYKNKPNRIFQLYTNHTVDLQWVTPDSTLLNYSGKYDDINKDIVFALGFPRILITGEAERTGTADPLYATVAPVKTMENFRNKILSVLQFVADEIAEKNNLSDSPTVGFEPIQLAEFAAFANALFNLYGLGNISRETLSKYFGIDWEDEARKLEYEKQIITERGIDEFAPVPYSPKPDSNNNNNEK